MSRTVSALLLGMAVGALVALTSVGLAGGWYEYSYAPGVDVRDPTCSRPESRGDLVRAGWQVVPSQSDACYVRRARLRLH